MHKHLDNFYCSYCASLFHAYAVCIVYGEQIDAHTYCVMMTVFIFIPDYYNIELLVLTVMRTVFKLYIGEKLTSCFKWK